MLGLGECSHADRGCSGCAGAELRTPEQYSAIATLEFFAWQAPLRLICSSMEARTAGTTQMRSIICTAKGTCAEAPCGSQIDTNKLWSSYMTVAECLEAAMQPDSNIPVVQQTREQLVKEKSLDCRLVQSYALLTPLFSTALYRNTLTISQKQSIDFCRDNDNASKSKRPFSEEHLLHDFSQGHLCQVNLSIGKGTVTSLIHAF